MASVHLPSPDVDDPSATERTAPRLVVTARQVAMAAWALVAVQLALRTYASTGGYLYWDDFILQSRAAQAPFPSTELLLSDHDGHVMPSAMAVAWVTTRVAPLSPLAVTVGLVLLQAAASTGVVLMLRRLFGTRPLVLVPLAVYLFAPLTLPSFLWWSAALNALPLQAGLALAVWGHVGYLRRGRTRDAAVGFAATVVALSFVEKAVVIPLALVGVTWLLDPHQGYLRSLGAALASRWRLWFGYGVLVGGYLAWFASSVDRQGGVVETPGEVVDLLRTGVLEAFGPAAVGGPLFWSPIGFANAYADPPAWLVVLAWNVLVVLVVATCWARPRARRGWTLLLVYVLADLAAFAVGRGGTELTAQLPLSLRYTADAAVVLALVLGAALMPPAGEPDPPRALAVRAWARERPSAVGVGAFLVADVFVLLALVSTVNYARIWADNPARGWVQNAQQGVALAPAEVPVLPQPVPPFVLFGLAYPDNLTDRVLYPVRDRPPFGDQTTALVTFDGDGNLVAGTVQGPGSLPPPDGSCWLATGGGGLVRLDARALPWVHTVHLGYLASTETAGTVALGAGDPVPVRFEPGLGDVYLTVTGGGSLLYLTVDDPEASVCIGEAAVGSVVPRSQVAP